MHRHKNIKYGQKKRDFSSKTEKEDRNTDRWAWREKQGKRGREQGTEQSVT